MHHYNVDAPLIPCFVRQNRVNPASTYLKLILTMFFWGGTWVAARIVVQDVSPLAAACWRFLFASVSLLALVIWHRGGLPAISRRQLLLWMGGAAAAALPGGRLKPVRPARWRGS